LTQLSKGDEVLLKPGNPGGINTVYGVKKIDLGKRHGENTLIATLNLKGGLGGTMEVPVTEIQEILHRDPETGAKEQFIEYIYSETQKVVRTQWSDRRCVYEGKKSKKIRPFHKTTEENWVAGKGDAPWPLLRQSEAHSEIVSGGIVFLPAGEQACHYLWQLGLTATTKQGGETNPKEILEALQPSFEEARKQAEMEAFDEPAPDEEPGTRELKPLLVIWGDNDATGAEFADGLVDVAWKYKATAIKIDPLRLWSGMPFKGDAKDWISWCRLEGISDEEMLYRLELEIEAAIDEAQEDVKNRRRRANWDAPTSWQGEIGRWVHKKNEPPQWKTLRRIERYGQQPDGTWVFCDRQYKPNGERTTEAETGWVFCDVSSEGDQIPCPELAPENPIALKRLVDAARNFFGEVNLALHNGGMN
jgi:hypothetical protein